MKKKIEEVSTPIEEVKETPKVAPLTNDFGRQDLNELRDKLNEIIATL